ncbi:hypothetical protein ACFPES_04100 [Paenibacillus sp. GCM10023248]|uniref:hypothetical protein n=1 Tax=unclassified Paenibacillus TaxID=185978 RepID=UPI0023797D3C|nr:hypothetical protein [Paenibacillus sp. MAHUQ-63]MDD9266209.1 hypothetical protein [Paenibacillus sp. MAHUQ-63]
MRNWIIVAFILLVIGLIGIGGTFSIGNIFGPGGVKVEQNQTVEGEGVRNIKVQSGSTDFQVVKGSKQLSLIELNNSVIKIELPLKIFLNF